MQNRITYLDLKGPFLLVKPETLNEVSHRRGDLFTDVGSLTFTHTETSGSGSAPRQTELTNILRI